MVGNRHSSHPPNFAVGGVEVEKRFELYAKYSLLTDHYSTIFLDIWAPLNSKRSVMPEVKHLNYLIPTFRMVTLKLLHLPKKTGG